MNKFFLFIVFTFYFSSLNGQGEVEPIEDGFEKSSFILEANIGIGRIVKHNSLFGPNVTELSSSADISYIKNTNGTKAWHQLSNYPGIISSFQYGRFGDKEIFGSVYALMLGLQHSKELSLGDLKIRRQFRYRFGPSWLDKPYNLIDNSENNVIGSHLNLTLRLDYGYEWMLNKSIGVLLSGAVQHYSNGRSALPNLGINLFSINAAFRNCAQNTFRTVSVLDRIKMDDVDTSTKLNVRFGFGRHENFIANGPKYPIYTFSVFASKNRSQIWTWLYGVEGSYFQSVSQYILENETGDEYPHRVATRLIPFGGFELRLGLTSFVGTVGTYFYKPFLADGFLPTKIGFQQYIPLLNSDSEPSLFIGGYLKAHGAKAEFLEMSLGYRF